MHDSAHLAIVRLVDVTDDTVTVQKMLLEELKSVNAVEKYTATGELKAVPVPPLVSVATHRTGRQRRNRNFLGDNQGCLREQTVHYM